MLFVTAIHLITLVIRQIAACVCLNCFVSRLCLLVEWSVWIRSQFSALMRRLSRTGFTFEKHHFWHFGELCFTSLWLISIMFIRASNFQTTVEKAPPPLHHIPSKNKCITETNCRLGRTWDWGGANLPFLLHHPKRQEESMGTNSLRQLRSDRVILRGMKNAWMQNPPLPVMSVGWQTALEQGCVFYRLER